MSLEKRLTTFNTEVVTKSLAKTKSPSYLSDFQRLVLVRRLVEFVASFLLIFSGQQFLIHNAFFSPIWSASGVALAALFLRGNFLLIGIFFGMFVSYSINHFPWLLGITASSLFVTYLFAIRQCALKWIGPITPVASRSVFWKMLSLIAGLSAFHLLIQQYLLYYFLFNAYIPTFFNFFAGWLGEINGILYLTPLCLMFDPFTPQRYFTKKARAWWGWGLLIIACHFLYYFVPHGTGTLLLGCLSLITLGLYARHFGKIPTAITLLGVSLVYVGGVRGSYHLFYADSSPKMVLALLALFTMTAIVSLSIAISTVKRLK